MIGKILNNRYKIEEKIGEGGMAVIYKAEDLRLNRLVALKVLRAEFLSDAEFVKRFLKEANFSAKLSHPNCLNIYDVEKTENLLYIVMEYFESKNLKEIIKIEAPFSIEKALEIIQNIVSALEYAHQAGIIHRDIKPHNILINQEGLVKITDFGIAKAISGTTLTQNGNLIGSVHYLSPEQAQGKEITLTSDIYSLGIIIYEMLTGKLPFQGENIVEIALKQVQEEPVLPSSLNSKIPPFLEKVILKILAKDPQKRYQNIAELKEELKVVYKEIKKEKVDLDKTFIKEPINLSKKMKTHKNNNLLSLLILITITITLLYLLGKYFIVGVPNLINLSYENAAKVLKESGLSIKIKGYSYKKDLAELIIEQNPASGKKVLRGAVIDVILNKIEGEVKVPNLIGMNLEDAQKELSVLSLAYQIEKETPSTMAKEIIISQHPAAFTLVEKNSLIFLEISSGNLLEKLIPNIVGLSKGEAEIILGKYGLKLNIEESIPSFKVEKGKIISQNPPAGSPFPNNLIVKIILSMGIENLKTPDLIGLNLNDAKEEINKMGLELIIVGEDFGDDSQVIWQSPGVGEKLEKNIIKVKCIQTIVMPELIGKTKDEVLKLIEKSGLVLGEIEIVQTKEAKSEIILDQEPKAGIEIPKGSKVNLVISKGEF